MRNRNARFIGCLVAALVLLSVAPEQFSAQVRIKIPRPDRKNPPATTSNLPTTTTQASPDDNRQPAGQPESASQPSQGTYVDDGFTWFEAVSFQETVNGAPVSTGWALKSSVRLVGEFPNRSAFKMIVSRAGQPVATTRCEGHAHQKAANAPGASFLWTIGRWKKETATKELGKFDVQVFAINGDTDAEKLVR